MAFGERKDLPNIREGIELYMRFGDGINPISVETELYKGTSAIYKIGPDNEGNVRPLQKFRPDGRNPNRLIDA